MLKPSKTKKAVLCIKDGKILTITDEIDTCLITISQALFLEVKCLGSEKYQYVFRQKKNTLGNQYF